MLLRIIVVVVITTADKYVSCSFAKIRAAGLLLLLLLRGYASPLLRLFTILLRNQSVPHTPAILPS